MNKQKLRFKERWTPGEYFLACLLLFVVGTVLQRSVSQLLGDIVILFAWMFLISSIMTKVWNTRDKKRAKQKNESS